MTTSIASDVSGPTDLPNGVQPSPARGYVALAGTIAVKLLIAGTGVAVGAFLGLVVALFSGLIDFTC